MRVYREANTRWGKKAFLFFLIGGSMVQQMCDIVFHKTTQHGNSDFLSRLPKTSEEFEVKDDITIFQISQIETLYVFIKDLRQETGKDKELGLLLKALKRRKFGVAVRIYRAANTRWKFGTTVNPDGVLQYTIDVQGTLVRRHVNQIHPVGWIQWDQVQDNTPNIRQRFPLSEDQENNPNLQHAETVENPSSKDLNTELGSSTVPKVTSTDVAVQDESPSSAKVNDSEMRSPPIPERRSRRIRRPP
ncbi:transposon Tf2-8 polyprotein [Trichonephila clavipes]|nr:transposon Tf2-8 polyprotein [Trichonephila clavipes]